MRDIAQMTDEELNTIGVKMHKHRKKIRNAASKYFNSSSASAEQQDDSLRSSNQAIGEISKSPSKDHEPAVLTEVLIESKVIYTI